MIPFIVDLLEGILYAAALEAQFEAVTLDRAARYLVFDPSSNMIWSGFADAGEVFRVNRTMRLRIEYVDHTLLVPPCAVRWSVQ